jgi:hypothetical protein
MNSLRSIQKPDSIPYATTPMTSGSDLYHRNAIVSFPAGYGTHLVYSMVDRSAQILPARLVKFLNRCDSFKRLEEYVEALCQEVNLDNAQAELLISRLPRVEFQPRMAKLIEEQASQHTPDKTVIESAKEDLRLLVESGLLVSEEEFVRRCSQRIDDETSPPRIGTIGMVTRDRVDILKRSLISYIANCKQYDRSNGFAVMDDSQSIHARTQTRELLQDLSRQYGVEIHYAGLEEKTKFAGALLAEGLPEEVVKFALFDIEGCGHATGANRNALLLHTVGDMVFTVDDDTVCNLGSIRNTANCLSLNSRFELLEFDFFPDRQTALQSIVPVDEDLLAGHELLLGRSAANCMSRFKKSAGLTFGSMSDRLLQVLQCSNSRILVTMPGIIGDSGMHSSQGYFLIGANSHKRLTQSRQVYRSACRSREILRSATCWTITDIPWCMATAMGYDNRAILPPFMPVKRNQDGLFGTVLRACFEGSLFGHVPRVIHHLPNEARFYQLGEIWKCASRYRLCDTVAACVRSFKGSSEFACTEHSLRALGKHLIELGAMSQPDFDEYVQMQMWQMEAIYICFLEHQLREYVESPRFWVKDIHKHLSELRIALCTRERFAPQDLLEGRDIDKARDLARRLTFKFGQLLYWWPEIIKVAGILRSRDQRLAARVKERIRA